jgi:hypothetical protein
MFSLIRRAEGSAPTAPGGAAASRACSEGDVEDRGEDQPEEGDADHAEEHRGAQRLAELPAGSRCGDQREHAQDEGEAGHQDRTKPRLCRLDGHLERGGAAFLGLLGEFDDQDRVLGGKRDEHDQADLGQDVVVHPPQVHARHRGQQRHRHDQDDRQRQDQAFELCGEHEEDEDHRHTEDDRRDIARRLLFEGDAGPLAAEAGGKALGHHLHRRDRLAGREAPGRLAIDLDRGEEIVAGDAIGAGLVLEGRDRTDRHHAARIGARLQLRDVGCVVAEGCIRLSGHAEGAAEQIEVVDVCGAQIDLERLEHAARGHAEHVGLGAIDIGIDTWRGGVVEREDVHQALFLMGPAR